GQEMAHAVAAQLGPWNDLAVHDLVGGFPSAERLSRRRQPGCHAKVVQQPVQVEAQQVLLVSQHRILERPIQKAHVLEAEFIGLDRSLWRHLFLWIAVSGGTSSNHERPTQRSNQNQTERQRPHLFHLSAPFSTSSVRKSEFRVINSRSRRFKLNSVQT